MGKKDDFSSFKDLLGKFGGADDDDDDDVEESLEVAAEDLEPEPPEADYDAGTREVIANRPDGFAEMLEGSPPYRDLESEEMGLLASFRVRTIFPDDVLAEVDRLHEDPPASDYEDVPWREDLRRDRIFTIDGEDARDFDDAICIRENDDGHEVSVHIADVSHYVRPGTAVHAEALARATSVYLADQVVPMLPEKLSNHLCSLVPNKPRLAFSVFMSFDKKGQRRGYSITKSVIQSMRRCTYKQVQALLDGVDDESTRAIADLKPDLEMFAEWTKTQQKLRDRQGSLRMQSGERKFKFDADGEVTDVYESTTYFSQSLIEETALAANQAVGDFFKHNGLPTIYRVHPEKDPEEVAKIIEMLDKYGVRVPKKDRLTGRDIGDMIRYARRLDNANAMIARIMGLMERATYEVQGHEDAAGHFGLAREHYLHFTSPIRRYPDLIVHRMLFDVLQQGDEAKNQIRESDHLREMVDMAEHCSLQADMSSMVEIAIGDLKLCQYMEPRIDERLMARVGRVSRYGIDIELLDEYVKGFLPARSIGSQVKQDGPVLMIRTRQGTKVFREGDKIEVTVSEVDFLRLKVVFALPEGKKRG